MKVKKTTTVYLVQAAMIAAIYAALALFFDIAAVSAVILGINRHSVRIHKVRKFLIAVAVLP